jgi:adhesin transport system membrane fusion protein
MTQDRPPVSENLLNLPVELRSGSSGHLARRTIYIISATVLTMVVWAAVSPIEEVAVASGKVVPASAISDINHLEGGIVEEVLIKEGDAVHVGQVLIRLNANQTGADLAQLEARAANLTIKRERLTASMNDQEPNFGEYGARYAAIAEEHRQAFYRDRLQAREERRQLEQAVERLAEQLVSARDEEISLVAQERLQEEQATIRKRSHAKGYTSKMTMLQAQAIAEQAYQRLLTARARSAELDKLHSEAQTKLRETVAERIRKLSEERADVAAQLNEAEETLIKYRDRVVRLDVVSPLDGIVHSLVYNVRGEVVKPGSLVAQVVPNERQVMAEVELQPHDIGHVRVGNEAELKLSNYDSNMVGIIRGEVELISPTTFETKDGKPYYKVRITLDRNSLHVQGRELPISPGTTLQAQILTGSKTLLRYMLKPVFQSLDTAFSER